MFGQKVYLRILEESDIPRTTQWINSPEIGEIMGYLPVKSLAGQMHWYKSVMQDSTRFIFAICENISGDHIGNVGIGNIDYVNRHCMFNIFLAARSTRSRGIGTEAATLALNFAFHKLNMNKVYLRTSARFVEANKMYLKIGFIKEGVMRQHYYTNGKYEDKVMYSILREEYERK